MNKILRNEMLLNSTVTDLLDQWARWSRSGIGGGSLETPTLDNSHWINDDAAMLIDGAVGQLGMVDLNKKNLGFKSALNRSTAIVLYYRKGYNVPMLANALKCGEPKATMILRSGESFIEAYLGLHQTSEKLAANY